MTEKQSNHTKCLNPATEELLGYSILTPIEEIKSIVADARKAQQEWEKVVIAERRKKILKIREYIVNNGDRLSQIISQNNGKTKVDAMATEIFPAAMAISYYCKNARRFLCDKKISGGNIILFNKRSKIIRVPFGVIGIISPWNYPFVIPLSEAVMGLLAGNAVLLKTASQTQIVGLALKEAIEYADLPKGIFNYVNIPGRIIGDLLLESGVNKIFFTGSVAVGKYLMGKASSTLTPLCLELGGNDAMIVCDDADPFRAAMGALWAGFQNSGQSCGGVERIYVHEKIYDNFMRILKVKVENMNVGYGEDFDSDMGCMTVSKQIETVKQHIKDALNKGAIIYAQSNVPADLKLKNFIPATVLINVHHDMKVMRDETFGPVVGVMKYKTDEEAIMLANDSYLGLTGSVWSKNNKRSERIARQIKAGVVMKNDHLMSHGMAETPWGGIKESGIGRTHGQLGFDEMTQPVVIVNDIIPFIKKNLWWHPFNKRIYDGLKGAMDLLYNKNIGRKIKGKIHLLKILPRMFKTR